MDVGTLEGSSGLRGPTELSAAPEHLVSGREPAFLGSTAGLTDSGGGKAADPFSGFYWRIRETYICRLSPDSGT